MKKANLYTTQITVMVKKDGHEGGFHNCSKLKLRVRFGLWLVLGFKVGLGFGQGLELRIVISAWLSILSHFTDLENLPLVHPI